MFCRFDHSRRTIFVSADGTTVLQTDHTPRLTALAVTFAACKKTALNDLIQSVYYYDDTVDKEEGKGVKLEVGWFYLLRSSQRRSRQLVFFWYSLYFALSCFPPLKQMIFLIISRTLGVCTSTFIRSSSYILPYYSAPKHCRVLHGCVTVLFELTRINNMIITIISAPRGAEAPSGVCLIQAKFLLVLRIGISKKQKLCSTLDQNLYYSAGRNRDGTTRDDALEELDVFRQRFLYQSFSPVYNARSTGNE